MTRLYHGSNQEIGEINLSLGLPDKDFGQGFYLTHLRHQAERMALSKCSRSQDKTPTVTVYEFDEDEAHRQKFRLFEEGYITLRQLASKITFPKDNSQHFFATERAVSLLRKVEVITL